MTAASAFPSPPVSAPALSPSTIGFPRDTREPLAPPFRPRAEALSFPSPPFPSSRLVCLTPAPPPARFRALVSGNTSTTTPSEVPGTTLGTFLAPLVWYSSASTNPSVVFGGESAASIESSGAVSVPHGIGRCTSSGWYQYLCCAALMKKESWYVVRPKKYTKSKTMTTSEMVLTRRRQRLFLPRLGSRPPILPLGERGERSRGMTPAFLAPLYFDGDKRDPDAAMPLEKNVEKRRKKPVHAE